MLDKKERKIKLKDFEVFWKNLKKPLKDGEWIIIEKGWFKKKYYLIGKDMSKVTVCVLKTKGDDIALECKVHRLDEGNNE